MAEILIIEDSPPIRAIYTVLLRDWGYGVCSAASTRDVVALIRSGYRPDAIVADYNLGGGDTGITAIETAEELLGRSIPAVMITGESSLPDVDLPILRKPVTRDHLKDVIGRLLGPYRTPLPQDTHTS
ncbi:MAG: response regulator [Magnetospirillum sp.]